MSTVPAATVALLALSAAGFMPATALVGRRVVVVPLLPLAGAVIAAFAATCSVAVGGRFLGWFVGLSVILAALVAADWQYRPHHRPWRDPAGDPALRRTAPRLIGLLGALALVGAAVWCLRGLATPTVGFDARALWLMRAGWFLQSHQQLLIKMRVPDVILYQSTYPPLVSAATALAWRLTGDQTARLGVVVIALLNTCALAVAAAAVVEAGRRAAVRLTPTSARLTLVPVVVGAVAAVLLVFVAFGITEPFMTNGYADPIWSLAAVGAVAYGLQLENTGANQRVALILLLVAGLSKDEGVATAGLLIGVIAVRGLVTLPSEQRRRLWWRPLALAVAEILAITAWPLVMRLIHARGLSSSYAPAHQFATRARASYHGMAPYLHVLVLAAALSVRAVWSWPGSGGAAA